MAELDFASDSDLVQVWQEGPAAHLRLNRPEKANAYNQAMLGTMETFVRRVSADPEIRVLVISGAGDRAFCAGADLNELEQRDWRAAFTLKSAEVFALVSRCPKVTLAAINGAAVAGGLELALSCDLRIAADNARFSFPEPRHGLIPAAGGTQRLAQVVGKARAKELILGGRVWGAEEALRFGLLSEVTEQQHLLPTAQRWVGQIARGNPVALQLAKKAIDLDASRGAGYCLESVAEALLYQLRREDSTSVESFPRGRDRKDRGTSQSHS